MSPQQPRVLLAEDDDDLRELIQQFLEERRYHVIAVEDGLELGDYLSLTHENPQVPEPNLILADVHMPGKDALEVLEGYRPVSPCPIVLISAFADDEVRRRATRMGATMVLDKPINPAVLSSVVAALLATPPTETRRRLLVAEDDDEMRAWLGLVLESNGGDVKEASSGWELINALKEEGPFDLVVSDVRMPGSSGLQVLAAARDAGLKTPFLLITAFSDESLRAAAAQIPDVEVLDKPFERSDFLAAIARLLGDLVGHKPGRLVHGRG